MERSVSFQGRLADDHTAIVDRGSEVSDSEDRGVDGAAEISEVHRRTVAFPKHRVRGGGETRKHCVGASARRADRLTVVVDSHRKADRIPRQQRQLTYGAHL